MRNGEPNVYTGLCNLRNGYMQQQWSRVQMFLLFNTVALPLVLGTGQPKGVKFVISVVAVFIHALILNATNRANFWIEFLDAKLAALEGLDQDSSDGMRIGIFRDSSFAEMRSRRLASRKVFAVIGIGIAIFWLGITIYQGFTTLK